MPRLRLKTKLVLAISGLVFVLVATLSCTTSRRFFASASTRATTTPISYITERATFQPRVIHPGGGKELREKANCAFGVALA
jgi:hypothetical protein